jgi:hypothetical protein
MLSSAARESVGRIMKRFSNNLATNCNIKLFGNLLRSGYTALGRGIYAGIIDKGTSQGNALFSRPVRPGSPTPILHCFDPSRNYDIPGPIFTGPALAADVHGAAERFAPGAIECRAA